MQSPCLSEIAAACGGGSGGGSSCCPTPLLNFPSSTSTFTSTSTTTPRTSAASRRDFAAKATASVFPDTTFTNPESLPAPPQAFSLFLAAFPQYQKTNKIDQIRTKKYPHLSLSNHTCLDYIGIGLFSYHQFQKHSNPFPSSNPNFPFFGVSYKSGNLKSRLLENSPNSHLESAIKTRIFKFLNVSESDYALIFTANRTSAFKLLSESYPFQISNKLLTVYDYESEAVEAMVSTSQNRGALTMSAEFSWPRLRINSRKLKEMIVSKNKRKKSKKGLFVFPLHSRITGARYPYLWMSVAQENRWHVLVDACALGPKDMDCFGLSLFRPDFLVCSFYKVFGENPSGFGCLLVKKSVISILDQGNSCSSSAGIVNLVPADKFLHFGEDSSGTDTEIEFQHHQQIMSQMVPSTSSFSGPISYQGSKIENLELGCNVSEIEETVPKKLETKCRGLDQVDSLGLILISTRARCLINWLVSSLLKLKHPNSEGVNLVKIYGPKVKFDRGPALAFNVFDWKGEKVEPVLVQKLADRSNISLSYGFLQNIWFSDKYAEEKGKVLERKEFGKDDDKMMKKCKANLGISVVTAALGFLTNFEDAYKLWSFVAQFLDADFVEKERWRYTALNQRTVIEVL